MTQSTYGAESARPTIFPRPVVPGATTLVLAPDESGGLPHVAWLGMAEGDEDPASPLYTGAGGCPLLAEHWTGSFVRPGLRGYRLGRSSGRGACAEPDGGILWGTDWSPRFRTTALASADLALRIEAEDDQAQLSLVTDVETVNGGALRIRHSLTNQGATSYVVEGLEVTVPVSDGLDEILDFTGRWGRERTPQRRDVADGLWLRENRRGKTGLDAATVSVVGDSGFDFAHGDVVGVHVAWSGNSVHRVERNTASLTTIGGGELLLPGEVVLDAHESYTTPWVYVAASSEGLDGLAAVFHGYQRSLAAHPSTPRPVNLNVWEAVHFDHDLDRLCQLADLASEVGVERYVLDDGWFRGRRNDRAGLGDWYEDEDVWPGGLAPLIDHVRARGMQFGLWFEPEMINPNSDLYRRRPDWVLSATARTPLLERHQLVLDLSQNEVRAYLFERIHTILSRYEIAYVKWDHNRDLLEAGSRALAGAPTVHAQTVGYYWLLDELREAHPDVEWESCAAGGGRIDLQVLDKVQRVWTSDMTDPLERQAIQRWTTQLVAPEYLGSHISSPRSQQTGRVSSLDFRAATALFGHFGIEWDLTATNHEERAALAAWVGIYKRYRGLLHSGRVVRVASPDPAVWLHGVLSQDRRTALMAQVQLGESASGRPARLPVPGLDPAVRYRARWVGPVPNAVTAPYKQAVDPVGPLGEGTATASSLSSVGLPMPRRQPQSVTLVAITAA